jgi:hypothetical protein
METELRVALIRATEEIQVSPSLLADVRAGGRSRLIRRRTVLGAGLAVATATVGGAVATRFVGRDPTPPVASPWFDDPTRGSRAGDKAYLTAVILAWQREIGPKIRDGNLVTGPPHVVWAGDTPVGPAAVVTHRFRNPSGDPGLMGFIGPDADGRPGPIALGGIGPARSTGFLVGERHEVLVMLDTGDRVTYSTGRTYEPDGRITRRFQPLVFSDGAAVVRVPPQRPRLTLAVLRELPDGGAPVRRGPSEHPLANVHDDLRRQQDTATASGQALDWSATFLPLAGAGAWPSDREALRAKLEEKDTPALNPYRDMVLTVSANPSPWYCYGTTPDGRLLSVREIQYDTDPGRLFALLSDRSRTTVAYGGPIDANAVPPVRMRLPDGQGWVVADRGAMLRHRTGDGAWQNAGRDAALLPPAATEVEVTRPGWQPVTAPLTPRS